MSLPRAALKEWAAVIRGLERGRQAVLLRKGGIHERGFDVKAPRFWLFPTYLHQEPGKFRPEFRDWVDEVAREADPSGARLTVRAAAEVVDSVSTTDRSRLPALAALTAMTAEELEHRYSWNLEQALHVLVVRTLPLVEPLELTMKPAWGGCRSWVEVDPPEGAVLGPPVLDEQTLAGLRTQVHEILGTQEGGRGR